MVRRLSILIGLLAWTHLTYAAEFAVVQCDLPTTNGGTTDCTSSGFGTPKGALVFGGYGTANGTAVDHAGLWVGAYDGTRQNGLGFVSEHNQADSDTGYIRDSNSMFPTLLETDHSQNGDCTASWITNGVRLTCADAPPAAYKMNVLLVGGAGVSNAYVNEATGHATQNSNQAITDPGFTPDVIIAWAQGGSTAASGAHSIPSLGFATCPGGVVQRAASLGDMGAQAGMNVASLLATNRLVAEAINGATYSTLELASCDANGFTVTTRDAATGPKFGYMAIKMNGLSVKLLPTTSPSGTGSQSITGVGFTPQAGLMLSGEWAAVDTVYVADDGEVLALSAFTATASGSAAYYAEDSNGTSWTESITDSKMCRTRKDALDYATCTFSQWTSDGVDRNYTTNVGGTTQQAMLFFQQSVAGAGRRAIAPVMY